ncbi:hypothetical protein, partial [Paenisporosarcina sp. TG-14]|uniref:hypothetical protein n=1 Tax=Paenisporosarcina sp. TG-14 TaxID=1231057 RepID=UPI00056D5CD0
IVWAIIYETNTELNYCLHAPVSETIVKLDTFMRVQTNIFVFDTRTLGLKSGILFTYQSM